MKTIKKNSEYKRVSDKTADEMVSFKGWSFCPKQEWKQNVRDVGKPAPETLPGKKPQETPVKKKKTKKQEEYKKPNKKDKKDA